MNHIYKVIWNKAKHCYTVVSEIAKNHSTSSVTKKKVSIAAILAAGMLSGFSPMVSGAADTTNSEAVVYNENKTSLKSTNSNGVGENAIALGKGASAVDDSIAIGNDASVVGGSNGKGGVALGKKAHAGHKGISLGNSAISGREGTIVIGDTTNVQSLYSTVVGTDSKITSDGTVYTAFGKSVIVQGAVSTSFGAHNTSTNEDKKIFSGVANSIIGSVNTVTNSNGVTIQGTGNTVSNAYKDMNIGLFDLLDFKKGDYSSLAKKDSGAIAIIGGGNTISDQLSSTVIGFGNTLKGKNSAGVFTGGSHNTLTNVSNSLVMGDHNTLEGRKNVISLGNENTVTADEAVAIGNGTTVSAKSGVAIGVGSVADRVAGSEKGVLGAFAPDIIPDVAVPTWRSTAGAVSVGSSSMTRQIINVAAGTNDTDAVNVAQLKKALESIDVDAGTGIKVDKITKDGKTTYKISTNIVGSETPTDKTTVDKTTVTTNQTDTGNTDTSQGTTNGTSTKTGETVTVSTETKATHFGADNNETANVQPGQTLNINGDEKNISTSVNGNSIKVKLNENIKVESVTANSVTVGDTSITTDGLTIKDGPSITKNGINGGNKQVTKVADGVISATSTDAVNGSQLFATNQQVAQNAQSISKLGNRINKVGAGAAALAALHPLDFDPDDKWDIAAGYGNYNGENAAAIGAYYRPNEDTMFSVGGSFGNGENMVNAGVSLKLGQGNHVSTSKVAMAKEIKDLRKEMEGLKSALLDANAGKKLDTSKLQLFPDVPKNHWAYEYVSTLKGNGALTGYPDGEFKGDRPMTRYEFATMLYKAMLEGATLSDKILKEFAPELERFTVDTVHQDKDGKPTVERVRTVKAEK
uniref:ESPR-type extended signal peptide-containing protein n=1 Tax=Dialister sp. TaxID=1955814 RepID=UPI0040269189